MNFEKLLKDIFEFPARALESLDGEGQTTEELGGVGKLGSEMVKRIKKGDIPYN